MQSVERRGLERFELKILARIQAVTPDPSPEMQDLYTSNICSGGAFFQTPRPLPEGTEVKIDLTLHLDKLKDLQEEFQQVYIKIKGKVLRTEPLGMSVSFDNDYLMLPLNKLSG